MSLCHVDITDARIVSRILSFCHILLLANATCSALCPVRFIYSLVCNLLHFLFCLFIASVFSLYLYETLLSDLSHQYLCTLPSCFYENIFSLLFLSPSAGCVIEVDTPEPPAFDYLRASLLLPDIVLPLKVGKQKSIIRATKIANLRRSRNDKRDKEKERELVDKGQIEKVAEVKASEAKELIEKAKPQHPAGDTTFAKHKGEQMPQGKVVEEQHQAQGEPADGCLL